MKKRIDNQSKAKTILVLTYPTYHSFLAGPLLAVNRVVDH